MLNNLHLPNSSYLCQTIGPSYRPRYHHLNQLDIPGCQDMVELIVFSPMHRIIQTVPSLQYLRADPQARE
jgi:hypothetical protein